MATTVKKIMGLMILLAGLGLLGFVIFRLIQGDYRWGEYRMWAAIGIHVLCAWSGARLLYSPPRGDS